ncbi:hypothetical protein J6590_056538 [Homalodisca vitripennis]|nr:hypothetical protein J6590_056538 [Homalodisca vitripennis]
MENEDGIVEGELITSEPPGKGRKKRRYQESWKKSVAKRMRYSCKKLQTMPSCNHNGGSFKCGELGMQDIRKMNQKYYSKLAHQVQNEFILNFVTVETPKRVKLKHAKLKDIKSLLTSHFGSQWNMIENLQFYQSLIQTQETINNISEAEDDNDEIPVDDDLHV